jgi:hypothetical protein
MAIAYNPEDNEDYITEMWDKYLTCSTECVDKHHKDVMWGDLVDIVNGDKAPGKGCNDYDTEVDSSFANSISISILAFLVGLISLI